MTYSGSAFCVSFEIPSLDGKIIFQHVQLNYGMRLNVKIN